MPNVLVVDDSKTMRNIEKNVLAKVCGDCQISEAGDGVEALAVIGGGKSFDLILVDWNMPNMDGFTLIKKIRETDRSTPIMMVTTEAEKPRIIEAIKAGANN